MFRHPTLLRQIRALNTPRLLLTPHRNVLRQPFTSSPPAHVRPRPVRRYVPPAAFTPTATPQPVSAHPPPPPPPPPPPGRYKYPGKTIVWGFFALSVAATLIGQFPNRMLPPVPDPPSLQPYANTPLLVSFIVTHPLIAAQLFAFRLRRGEYYMLWRTLMTIQPFLYVLDDTPNPYFTWVTHLFAHGSVFHWLFCFMALRSLVPGLAMRFGTARTAVFLLASGAGAAAVQNVVIDHRLHEKANREPEEGVLDKIWRSMGAGRPEPGPREYMVRARVKLENLPIEDRRELLTSRLGSSAALMAGMVVTAIEMPATEWMLMFVPVGIPARVVLGMLVAFDGVGAFWYDYGWGIDHMGHLAGDAMGLLLYMLWFRKVKYPRKWRIKREALV